MAELIAKTPCDGLLPVAVGQLTLKAEETGVMTSLTPFRGRQDALSYAMRAAHDLAFPAPNRTTGKAGARALWFGRDQAMLMGPEPAAALAEHAALSDQSDAWAVVRLDGPGAQDVMARLVPIDIRVSSFKRGHTARTQLQHMMASVTRLGADAFLIMVFRSMAATLVHDVQTAMEAVEARG